MNLNKLFPRLSIRAKLAIAFSLIALAPLAIVTLLGTSVTVGHLRHSAKQALSHDLDLAQDRTATAFRDAERHVTFLARSVLGELILEEGGANRWLLAERVVSSFLAPEPAFFRIKLVDEHGMVRFLGRAEGSESWPDGGIDAGGTYYSWRAAALTPGEVAVLPVELQTTPSTGDSGTVPAIAFLVPIHDAEGRSVGVVVGEAYASVLLRDIDIGSPALRGTTGLIDRDGLFVYHSARKRSWANLLASRAEINLHTSFEPAVADAILSGEPGSTLTGNGRIVEHRPLGPGSGRMPALTLYREVPLQPLAAPVTRFLTIVGASSALVVAGVLMLGHVAARQFTLPIYRLREGARSLVEGGLRAPLMVETNDELEDLARDFTAMAATVSFQREELERVLGERTRALQVTHAELHDVLEHSVDAIVGLDREDGVRIWNRGAEELFQYAADDAIGRSVWELIGPRPGDGNGERAFVGEQLRQHGSLVNFRTTRFRRDGSKIPVTLTQTMIAGADDLGPLGSSLIIRDHRPQAAIEDQMRRSERLAAMSVMAAGLAHEVNNPLAVIAGRIECMKNDARSRGEGNPLMADLHVLHEHVLRLMDLTSHLLQFARDEGGVQGRVDIGEIARGVARMLEAPFAARELSLGLLVEPDLPTVSGDEKALETVLVNLLLNAMDATPRGGQIALELRRCLHRRAVEIEVRDNGSGIPAEQFGQIFEPFFTTKLDRGGTGLGLAVCRSVVERHQGQLRVDSVVGKGSSFTIHLPAREEVS